MRRTLSIGWFVVVSMAWLARGAVAQSDDFKRGYQAARVELAKNLNGLAKWCHQKQLYLERDRLYTQALEFDTNNKEARQALGGTRGPDGTWKMPPLKEAKNRNEKALAELPAETKKQSAVYCDTLLTLLDAEAPDPKLRTQVYDEILTWDPDEPRVRKRLDQVKLEDRWVMPETAAAKARRVEIKALATKVRADVPAPAKIEPVGADTQLADAWTSAAATDAVRVISKGDLAESESIARDCQAMVGFVNGLFGTEAKIPQHFTIYVLLGPEHKEMFLSRLQGLKDKDRAALRALMGCGVPGTANIAVWYPDAPSRLDCCVRQTLGHMFREGFRVTSKCGWIFEGMGLYLTRELIGTRLTWFATAQLSEQIAEQHALRALLMVNDTNWMNEASKLLSGDKAPPLDSVLTKDVDHMDMHDMLIAYALSAYLLEGRAAQAADVVERFGKGEKPATAVPGALGCTVEELQTRLATWLKERR